MGSRAAKHEAFIKDNFGSIWPVHLSAFTELLIQLRTRFDGDLDLLLIMAAIGDRTRPENWTPELLTYRQLTNGPENEHLQSPINMQSVADYTGIPRETVRRKVKELQNRGWVHRDNHGQLSISRSAGKELENSTMNTISYLAALRAAFETG